jgi:ABC-type transport system substrate-binding protein
LNPVLRRKGMKFGRYALMLAVATAAATAGCSTSAPSSAASRTIPLLRIGTNFPISTLNPIDDNGNAWAVNQLSLETLVKLGPDNTLEPELATSFSHPTPVTYIYHLRHGVKFWDGHDMTSADVVFSWDQYRNPTSTYTSNFTAVKNITAAGPYTVVVTLVQPNAAWPFEPAQVPGVFEKRFYQAHQSRFGSAGTLVMGTGPWEVDSFDPTTGAKLSANPHWWGGVVPIQRVTVGTFADETSLALAMRAGEIDVDPYVLDTATFARSSGARLLSTLTNTVAVFSMNTKVAPWSDIHVRRAVAYALNRSDIIAAAAGYNSPVYTYYPPAYLRALGSPSQVSTLLDSIPLYPYNVAKAKAELAQSAYPHGFSATLYEYTYGSSVNTSEVVAAELQKVGINARVKVDTNLGWEAAMGGPLLKRPTDFATGYCGGPDISSCDTRLGSWDLQQGQWNSADWAPAGVDKLLKAALAAPNPAERFAAYAKILRAMQADVPYVGLYQEGVSVALSGRFTVPGYASTLGLNQLSDYALYVKSAG